ncbi:hypothetical protein GY45DRAFT_1329117 [Cubamyces sp. BRFM 1775]|nr:hypothetical protein GY45DRAFT_1329117 [Cubamyces sp. BRFM 1775]
MSMGDGSASHLPIRVDILSLTITTVDAKFPGQRSPAIPPSPSKENPGQVYPQSDPRPAPPQSVPGTGGEQQPRPDEVLGNPFVLDDAFSRLDAALSNVISKIQNEERSVGAASTEDALLRKFKGWQDELTQIRSGRKGAGASGRNPDAAAQQSEGGLFAD